MNKISVTVFVILRPVVSNSERDIHSCWHNIRRLFSKSTCKIFALLDEDINIETLTYSRIG